MGWRGRSAALRPLGTPSCRYVASLRANSSATPSRARYSESATRRPTRLAALLRTAQVLVLDKHREHDVRCVAAADQFETAASRRVAQDGYRWRGRRALTPSRTSESAYRCPPVACATQHASCRRTAAGSTLVTRPLWVARPVTPYRRNLRKSLPIRRRVGALEALSARGSLFVKREFADSGRRLGRLRKAFL